MSTYDNLQKDPLYRTVMSGMFGRWQKMLESDAFKAAFRPQGAKAAEELRNVLYGMQDIYGAEYEEDGKAGLKEAQKMKTFLNRKLPAGQDVARKTEKSYYAALKQVAKKNKIPMKTFYEDVHYMNEMMDLGLDMEKLDKELVVPKVRNIGEYNWENYAKAHLVNPPYSPKLKRENLAKAMAGAFLAGEKKRNPDATEYEFTRKNADNMTKYIMDKPAFKRLCADLNTVDQLLEKGAKDPDALFDDAVRIRLPFYKIGDEKCREILGNLMKMYPLMDGANAYDAKWRALSESIATIDLTSDDPKLSGSGKLQEILDRTTEFMKGKKSLRKTDEKKNCFDQSLDVLAELAKASPQAEAHAQVLVDRINEVRKGHDSKYKNIGIRSYGVNSIWRHTNSEDEKLVNDYYNELKYEDGVRPKVRRYERHVFESYPMNDFTLLTRAPQGIAAKKLRRTATRDLHEFMENKVLSEGDAVTFMAAVLALSDTKMYFRESGTIGRSDVVIDEGEYNNNVMKYVMDPALMPLARKYASPQARLALTGGSDDVLNVNIKQLKKEYADAKRELAEAQNPAGAKKAGGAGAAQPEGAQAVQAEGPKQNQNVPKQGQNVPQQGQNVPKQPSGPQAGF